MHKLLARQLRRAGVDPESLPENVRALLALVDDAYAQADEERELMARSIELTSHELLERNQALREDLFARRRAEGELKRIIEGLPNLVLIRRGSTIVYINELGVRRLGYESAAQLIGRSVLDFIPPDERERAQREMKRTEAGEPSKVTEYCLVARDGARLLFERSLADLVEFEGAPAVLLVAADLTEIRKLQTRVQVADRMASLGTMAAGVAHEINNPLAYVVANIDFAAEIVARAREGDVLNLEECEGALGDAAAGARRVQRIVGSLRAFSRVDDDARTAVSVNDILEQSIELAFNQIRHRARLVRQMDPVPIVYANEGRLAQVFVNLLVNAAHAIPEGDPDLHAVTVRTHANERGEVVVEVTDTGIGIAPDVLPRIFEPFFTTKPRGVGTGLGLSICHGIVQALGGTMEVDSELGRGACFRVILPRGAAKSAPPATQTAVSPRKRARVLVVDDEPAIGSVVRRLLVDDDVVQVVDAGAALRELRTQLFDVVISDLMMPGTSGMELYEAACRRDPNLAARFVFVTGCDFTDAVQEFFDRTQAPRLAKPFTATELRAAVGDVLRNDARG